MPRFLECSGLPLINSKSESGPNAAVFYMGSKLENATKSTYILDTIKNRMNSTHCKSLEFTKNKVA